MLSFVIVYNNKDVMKKNILYSPCLKQKKYQVITKPGDISASKTNNEGLKECENQIVIFVHQDVFLPSGWDENLIKAICDIENNRKEWGVLGCYGVNMEGKGCGYVYSNGLGRTLGAQGPWEKAQSVDEMVIVLNRKHGIKFDEKLPGYHLHGTDICMHAQMQGLNNYIIKNFCIHNSLPIKKFDHTFWAACNFIRKKWKTKIPLKTPCVRIPKSYLVFLYIQTKMNAYYFIQRKNKRNRKRLQTKNLFDIYNLRDAN